MGNPVRSLAVVRGSRLFLLLTALQFASQASAADDVAGSLASWRRTADALCSYDVMLRVGVESYVEQKNAMMKVGEHSLRQRFLRGSWRVDLIETRRMFSAQDPDVWSRSGDDIVAFAFDRTGRDVRFFDGAANFRETQPIGQFSAVRLLAPQLYEAFRASFYGRTYYQMLQPRQDTASLTSDGALATLRFPFAERAPAVDLERASVEVTLDTGKGYTPVRIKIAPKSDSEMYTLIENRLTWVPDGRVWVPETVRRTIFSKGHTGDISVPAAVTTIEVEMAKSRFNVDIDPDVFELAFPAGTVASESKPK